MENEMKIKVIIEKIERALGYFGLTMFVMWIVLEDFTFLGIAVAILGPIGWLESRNGKGS